MMQIVYALVSWSMLLVVLSSCASRQFSSVTEPTNAQGSGDDYVIGPEDGLEVLVWRNDALSKAVIVRPDGKISLPLIGDVQAAGFTPVQLKDEITERFKLYYREPPQVSVIVQRANNAEVYILGEVQRPGKYPIRWGTTLLQGIALAGGFTPMASLNEIMIMRGSNDAVNNQAMQVRYKDIISGRHPESNISLKPGDTIIIPY